MGHCCSKNVTVSVDKEGSNSAAANHRRQTPASGSQTPSAAANGAARGTPAQSFTASPWQSPYPAGIAPSPSPARTPGRKFRWPLPPPSPAKPIMSALFKRQPATQPARPIPEEAAGDGGERQLDKSFGYSKNFAAKYELGKEVGRGHFGHTCWAKGKKGELKNQQVAVKIISKAKMTTAIAIEDVRREVKILKALSGHKNLIKFYDAFEDANNVYVVMELCEGGELLDRILARGGRYSEEDAKKIVMQMLSVVAFCHLQGVVHRDLKPENFLFATRDEDSPMKVIDFGLSDFIRPDQRLNDIVGSAYYVAPEVLHRSYSNEADIWSIGVITYILLCGSRPFWARTESGIFRSVLRADPNFHDAPWPSVSAEAKDFVKRLLNRDHRKRMSAAHALTHPWLRSLNCTIPLDVTIYRLIKSYIRATPLKRAALKAISKALTEDELHYLKAQFELLEPKDGCVSLTNFRMVGTVSLFLLIVLPAKTWAYINPLTLQALMGNATDAMKESRVTDILNMELSLGPTAYSLLNDWIRPTDRKLSFLGFTKFLHGVTVRNSTTRHRH
ncbi:calcium-dependent protein kinase [Striga asiatica]|uniref:non-specific serine/threonine protein kinase n=1 Tax=Striga asiatica TaxID=4170 RepID=A0A5A7PC64_STRAF|nr:calcium-dependent protein kinase [Striga asiatica]